MIDRCYIEITNVCNLNCDFCPKHTRAGRRLSVEEFDLLTDRVKGRVAFLYFHLMGEPLLHPDLPQFIRMAREKGFKTVLTSNGTLLHRAMDLLTSLPHKVQLSLHSHESNGKGVLAEYIRDVMRFSVEAAQRGTCIVLRLWNQGGRETENEEVIRLLAEHVPQPWKERPDGYRMRENLYLEFDRKFEWPDVKGYGSSVMGYGLNSTDDTPNSTLYMVNGKCDGYFCKALLKQIGVLVDGSLVPCCLDHDGDVVLGNLFHQSLDEILSSPRAQALVEGFRHHRATEALCRNCESALIHNSFRGKRKFR